MRSEFLPWWHGVTDDLVPQATANALSSAIRGELPWRYHRGCFFEQHEVVFEHNHERLPGTLASLLDDAATIARNQAQSLFGVDLSDKVGIAAHRLSAGQAIHVHNDDPIDGEAEFRLVLLLSDWSECGGGALSCHQVPNDPPLRSYPPVFNQAVALALSDRSYHSVEQVTLGTRYSLVFSFSQSRGKTAPPLCRLRDRWALLADLLEALGAARIPHSGTDLLTHLVGTAAMLHAWGASDQLCVAGMFHSVFGTRSLSHRLLLESEEGQLAEIIGAEALALVRRFAGCDSGVAFSGFADGNAADGELVLLHLANAFEQAQREPGPLALDSAWLGALAARNCDLPLDVRRWLHHFAPDGWRERFPDA